MKRKGRVRHNAVWVIVSCFYLGQTAVVAQQSDVPRPKPAARPMMEALPHHDGSKKPRQRGRPAAVTPPTILAIEAQPIDLTTALELANVQNPRIQRREDAHTRSRRDAQLAAAYFLPSINPGLNYDSHTGDLQQSSGNILSVNRSAFYIGAGSNAVAAGTVNIPGVYYNINAGAGFFAFLASRQTVRQREFESIAVRNQIFLQVTGAYSELLRAEGKRATQTQARDEARIIAKLTADFFEKGLGRAADANRAATQLARREADIQAAEAEILVASANLCRLLNLDPSIRLHPTDAVVVPQPLIPDPIPVRELIALGF